MNTVYGLLSGTETADNLCSDDSQQDLWLQFQVYDAQVHFILYYAGYKLDNITASLMDQTTEPIRVSGSHQSSEQTPC